MRVAGPWLLGWPVSIPLFLAMTVSALNAFQRNQLRSRLRVLWLVTPFMLPVLITLLGWLFEGQSNAYPLAGVPWPVTVAFGLFFMHVPLGALLVWKLPGVRWLAGLTSAFCAWGSFLAAAISMTVIYGSPV